MRPVLDVLPRSASYRDRASDWNNADLVVLGQEPTCASLYGLHEVARHSLARPDGKHAIRDVFEGVETAFKVATGSNVDLTEANIAKVLTPIVDRHFAKADAIAQRGPADIAIHEGLDERVPQVSPWPKDGRVD
jgi:hypothetical protein